MKPNKPAKLEFKGATQRNLFELGYSLQVVTPVFGGGVNINKSAPHQKKIDETTPLRGTAIRGQLRFWWRATHGCQLKSVAEMHAREKAIWGGMRDGSEEGSHVTVRVQGASALKRTPEAIYRLDERNRPQANDRDLAYGAFPIQPAQGAANPTPGALTRLEGTARLIVQGPKEFEAEVRDAVAAWIYLGGVGGRTRRGFGSLQCDDFKDAVGFLTVWEKKTGLTLRLVPSLVGVRFRKQDATLTPFDAQRKALGLLRRYRQEPNVGRNPGQERNRPGRSRWPEPDAIRLLTRQHFRNHAPVQMSRKFPRAAFGAPVIFHFKDAGDPRDATLRPKNSERMASPLIVRALRVGPQFAPAAIRLVVPGALEESFVLLQGKDSHDVSVQLSSATETRVTQLQSTDVLSEFLEYFAGNRT
jgi:CRISPR-associated protein Cmr1